MKTTKYDELELLKLKISELRDLCKKEGLKTNRKKVELIASLKTIPAFTPNDVSSSNLTLEDSEIDATISGSVDTSRPALCDVSVIMISSPLVKGCGKRKLANAVPDSNKENSETVPKTSMPLMEGLQRLTDSTLKGEEEMENLIKQIEEPAQKVAKFIEQKKMELDKCRSAEKKQYRLLLEEQLKEKERELNEKHQNEMKNKLNEQKLSLQAKFDIELQKKNEKIKSCTDSLQLLTDQRGIKDCEVARLNTAIASQKKDNETLKKEIQQVRKSLTESEEEKGTVQTLFEDLTKKMSLKDAEITHQTGLLQALQQSSNGASLMDSIADELTCIICQELFITTSTLPCAHSFCEMCLRTWFKTKKTCPVCRADVKLKVVFSVVLDRVIDCCIEKSSDDDKRKRTILLRERNEQKRTADAAADPQSVKTMFYKAGDVSGVASTSVASAASSSTASGGSSAGSSTDGAFARGRAGVVHRRRSRSVSPRREIVNRALQAINYSISRVNNVNTGQHYHHNSRWCYNCGRNHPGDCWYARPPWQR